MPTGTQWKLSRFLASSWPYLVILLVTSVYFLYILVDSRYFFYDDFTGFTFSVPRSYLTIITDSLASRDIDRHKFVGYLVTKLLYQTAGLKVEAFFAFNFLIHTLTCWLLYRLLFRLSGRRWFSLFLTLIYAWRFYLWWWSNIHTLLVGFFGLITIHLWLSFLQTRRFVKLWLIWLIFPLLVFSYGPGIFVYPALLFLTVYLKKSSMIKHLLPFLVLLGIYFLIFTHAPDSLLRFTQSQNPYYRPLDLGTFITTQTYFLSDLTGYLPKISWLAILIISVLTILIGKTSRSLLLLGLAYLAAIVSNSFFPNHTMFYYLYFPVIFIYILVSQLSLKKPLAAVILALLLFNPFYGAKTVFFRLRHPAKNFDKTAMSMIVDRVDTALAGGQTEIKLSNWDVTPNLNHAIAYGALPLWLHDYRKDNYSYSYSRETETIYLNHVEK